ncbi:hypothetical protein FS837_005953, partial [Tulasnella sp. UAMH 9824]
SNGLNDDDMVHLAWGGGRPSTTRACPAATATNPLTVPIYPSTTNTAAFGTSTSIAKAGANTNIHALINTRDRPRLVVSDSIVADARKWQAMGPALSDIDGGRTRAGPSTSLGSPSRGYITESVSRLLADRLLNIAVFGLPPYLGLLPTSGESDIAWNKTLFNRFPLHSDHGGFASSLPPQMGARPKVVARNRRIDERDDTAADPPQSQAMDPVPCDGDAGLDQGGVLDVARHINQRMKAFTYGRMRVERAWKERLENSNTAHFLDITEFTAVFGVGYDWLYDAWADPTGKRRPFGLPSSTSALRS